MSTLECTKAQDTTADTRTCSYCQKNQALAEFYRDNSKKDGRGYECKTCTKERSRLRYTNDKPRHQANMQRWYAKNRDRVNAEMRERRVSQRAKVLYQDARRRAKAKGLSFNLDVRALEERIARGRCELTGIEFRLGSPRTHRSSSLDRIVPALGYVDGNVRVVCWGINCALSNWGEDILLEIATGWLTTRALRQVGGVFA